eukprot:GHVT01088073.1.p1 GENE.GHVT01088073.1~~GHVT01088073.1.p1  ORF type:complete len:247 (+),score=9.54 GHVT01088073.1:1184-1924(+)
MSVPVEAGVSDGKKAEDLGSTLLVFGKHRNRCFRDVAATESGYCQWAMQISNPSGALGLFQAYLKALPQTGPSSLGAQTESAPPTQTGATSYTSAPAQGPPVIATQSATQPPRNANLPQPTPVNHGAVQNNYAPQQHPPGEQPARIAISQKLALEVCGESKFRITSHNAGARGKPGNPGGKWSCYLPKEVWTGLLVKTLAFSCIITITSIHQVLNSIIRVFSCRLASHDCFMPHKVASTMQVVSTT